MYASCYIPLTKSLKFSNYDPVEYKKCDSCSFETFSNLLLLRHSCLTRRQLKVYKCEHCDSVLSYLRSLKAHMKRMHTSSVVFKCGFCENSYRQKHGLADHIARKHSKDKYETYRCEFCPKTFTRKQTHSRHIQKNHQPNEAKDWTKCQHCNFRTLYKSNLKNHLIAAHNENTCNIKNCKINRCELCNFKSFYVRSLKYHMLRKHTKAENINWFKCALCDHKTIAKCDLDRHTRAMHDGKEPKLTKKNTWYKCKECDAMFKTKLTLTIHIYQKHKTEQSGRLFKCTLCDFTHVHKKRIEYHVNRKHLEQPVECKYCGAICKNKYALLDHIRSKRHTNTN